MPKRSLILVVVLISLLSISPIKADETPSLTLDECLKMVTKNSREYNIAQMRFEAAEASYDASRLSYYVPNLSLNFTTPEYSWYGDYQDYYGAMGRVYSVEEYYDYTGSLNLSQKLFTGADMTVSGLLNSYRRTSNVFSSYDEIRSNLQFNIEQPIFDWNRHKISLDKAKVDYDLAEIAYSEEANQVLLDLATNFIHYLTGSKQVRIAELKAEKAEMEYTAAQKKNEEGLIGNMEFAQKRADRMDRKLELIDSKQSFEEYEAKLLQMLRLDKKTALNLNQNINLEEFSFEKEQKRSIEQSSEVLKAEGEAKKRELELKESKSAGGIDGKINFYYGFLGRGPVARESFRDFNKNRWGVSVVLSVPVWDGGAHSSSIKSAKLSLEEAKKQSELAEGEAKNKFENLLNKLSTTWSKLELLKEELSLAGDDLNNAQKKMDLGLLSEGQMLDARIIFLETEVKYLNAVLDYKVSRIELDKMWGIIPNLNEE